MQRTAQFSKSKIPCLVRHRGGNYYASVKVSGKVIRRSLDTECRTKKLKSAANRYFFAFDDA